MGAGCSSPLKRLGGKKAAKHPHRDSADSGGALDLEHKTIDQVISASQQQQQKQKNELSAGHNLVVESEITIQSETNDDHPSSASYYTDSKVPTDETQKQSSGEIAKTESRSNDGTGLSATRIVGLGGNYTPLDRHLLVSPALSPAPSTCQSPAPPLVFAGLRSQLDLNDLNEAFRIVTLGRNDGNDGTQINRPTGLCSEAINLYAQQLVQGPEDLVNRVTIIFIYSDNSIMTSDGDESHKGAIGSTVIDDLATHVETNMRVICDENSFGLRFVNLSHDNLSKSLLVNNLSDASSRIFKREYRENDQRTIVIILSKIHSGSVESSDDLVGRTADENQLPSRIDAQLMDKILNLAEQQEAELLKQWYTQMGGSFNLNPVYRVDPRVLSESGDERDRAWSDWKSVCEKLMQALMKVCRKDQSMAALLKSSTNSHIDFILGDTSLHRRTLLIRYHPSNLVQQQAPISSSLGHVNELARNLPDPNKLTLKRPLGVDEFSRSVNDWLCENLSKLLEGFQENRISQCKYVPPFIERGLFFELTCQRTRLEYYLNNITENFQTKCSNFYNTQIRPILSGFISRSSSSSQLVESTSCFSDSKQSLTFSSNHIVVISGPRGCGKTTLFGQLIKHAAQDLQSQVNIIYRFFGQTLDSLTPNRLFRSICEQFCQRQGENIVAASYIHSARSDIIGALNKIIKQQDCLLLLDGIDSYDQTPFEIDFDWLSEIEASPRLKIIIMLETDSAVYKKILSTYTDATYITFNHPTQSEWAQFLSCSVRAKRFQSSGNLYDEIKKNDESLGLEFTYTDIKNIIDLCRMRQLNNESIYPELCPKLVQNSSFQCYRDVHRTIVKHLLYLMPYRYINYLLIVISSSRNGLSEQDTINLINLVAHKQAKSSNQMNVQISSSFFSYVKLQLEPWLMYIVCEKTVKIMFQREFSAGLMEVFASSSKNFQKLMIEVRETMLEYFNQHAPQPQAKPTTSILMNNDASKSRLSWSESIWLDTHASEVMNLMILLNPSKAKDYIMSKQNFFSQFIHRTVPEEFVEDHERIRTISGRKPSMNEDLQVLVKFIRQSIFALRYDGSQIYSQIYCRAFESNKSGKLSKSKKLGDILSMASCPPVANLLPISEASVDSFMKSRIGSQANNVMSSPTSGASAKPPSVPTPSSQRPPSGSSSSQTQCSNRQRIFMIKDNHRHVISLHPDRNCLFVWDIYEEKPVRVINNIDQPRDLRMVNHKQAVILCNRELRVYDLDSGDMMVKLKGVMNQKMPYFEVFGSDYVVTLARNRMYVNMLNLNTGELETTFKVGEDRFLNSLLVSATGGICVCGDETQKPFPLLVWNLNERRLMYDLRIDRHEFITRLSAISDDGRFVVSVCKQLGESPDSHSVPINGSGSASSAIGSTGPKHMPNFIVVYDLNSGTLFKKWKPGLDTCCVAISMTANKSGKVINSLIDGSILIWDLSTGSRGHTLRGHSAPADVIKVQNNRLFSMDSTCRDQSLRIWDLDGGSCIAVFSPDAPVSCCQISLRGDALVCGFSTDVRLSTLAVCKNETIDDVVKRNKRRKSSRSIYIFDENSHRKSSS